MKKSLPADALRAYKTMPLLVSCFLLLWSAQSFGQDWEELAKVFPDSLPLSKDYANFGYGLAADGDYLAVGSPSGDNPEGIATGIVEIYHYDGTSWAYVAVLIPSDSISGSSFGHAVAMSGDTIVVGACYRTDGTISEMGAAYVFVKPEGGWQDMTETALLLPSDGAADDFFGYSVAIKNQQIAVGSPFRNNESGLVYVFEMPENGWEDMTETAMIAGTVEYGYFGMSVAITDSLLAIGANGVRPKTNANGEVYLYEKNSQGEWTSLVSFYPNNDTWTDFGEAVAFHDNLLAVGSEDTTYIYQSKIGWEHPSRLARLYSSEGTAGTPYSIAFTDSLLAIGCIFSDNPDGVATGNAWVYVMPEDGWSDMKETISIYPEDGVSGNEFGYGIGVGDSFLAVGSPYHSSNATMNGTVYAFGKPQSGWLDLQNDDQIELVSESPVAYTHDDAAFGRAVAIEGSTAVIGAVYESDGAGGVYVFGWVNESWERLARLLPSDPEASKDFGQSVSISNNTILVGAYRDSENGIYAGSAYIFEKPDDGWKDTTETAKLTASDGAASDYFGAGSWISNNTVVIGAYGDDDNGSGSGSAYIFEKPEDGWKDTTETAKLTASDGGAGQCFGQHVAIEGNVIVAGAFNANGGAGAVYVFEKPESGWGDATENAILTPSDGVDGFYFGYGLAISGNTVVGGSVGSTGVDELTGALYVFENENDSWQSMTETAKLTASDGITNDCLGWNVAIDGDLIIGGTYGVNDYAGSAYVFQKNNSWKDTTESYKIVAEDLVSGDEFGYSVAISGDTLLAGAWGQDGIGSDSGAAYFFINGEVIPLAVLPQSASQTIIYPNPVSTSFQLQLADGQKANRVLVLNLQGKMVADFTVSENQVYDVSSLDQGMYVVLLEYKGTLTNAGKLIRE